jgi:hypothetical protein
MAGEPLDLLIKYIYIKNLVVITLLKVRLLIPLDLYNIYLKYSLLYNNTL